MNSTLELKQVLDLIIAKAVEMLECEAGQGSAGAHVRAERQAEGLLESLLSEAFHE